MVYESILLNTVAFHMSWIADQKQVIIKQPTSREESGRCHLAIFSYQLDRKLRKTAKQKRFLIFEDKQDI